MQQRIKRAGLERAVIFVESYFIFAYVSMHTTVVVLAVIWNDNELPILIENMKNKVHRF